MKTTEFVTQKVQKEHLRVAMEISDMKADLMQFESVLPYISSMKHPVYSNENSIEVVLNDNAIRVSISIPRPDRWNSHQHIIYIRKTHKDESITVFEPSPEDAFDPFRYSYKQLKELKFARVPERVRELLKKLVED